MASREDEEACSSLPPFVTSPPVTSSILGCGCRWLVDEAPDVVLVDDDAGSPEPVFQRFSAEKVEDQGRQARQGKATASGKQVPTVRFGVSVRAGRSLKRQGLRLWPKPLQNRSSYN